MQASKLVEVVPGDYKEILRRCGGFYECPKDSYGKRLGPLVGYAGTYTEEGTSEKRQYVGDIYCNFAMAEEFPQVMAYFAEVLAEKIRAQLGQIDYVLAAPMGGITLAVHLAERLDCRYVFAEKKVTALASKDLRQQETMQLVRHQIDPGSNVLLIEDVCNNFSTTGQLVDLVSKAGSEMVGVACALSYSEKTEFNHSGLDIPVIAMWRMAMRQYRQDDPEVVEDMEKGNFVLKPKNEWARLMDAMNRRQIQ